MFMLTLKWNKKTAVLILIGVAALLCALILYVGVSGRSRNSSDGGARSNEDRLAYLSTLGWECERDPISERTIVIPRQFGDVFEEYNNLQKRQGFDLSPYAGLEATLYLYKVTNYPGNDSVLAQLIVLDNEVIGGDIHSAASDGFMHGLK